MRPVELSTLNEHSTLPQAVVNGSSPWMVQILDTGSGPDVALTYELNYLNRGAPYPALHRTREAWDNFGTRATYPLLLQLYGWLDTVPPVNTIDVEKDDWPAGHPYPILIYKEGSTFSVRFEIRPHGGVQVKVWEGDKEDLFLAQQVENQFMGRDTDQKFTKEVFEWLEKGFPNLWDHLLE